MSATGDGGYPQRCDVVVVGGGSAAFEAAVAARQLGAERVVMLEKAPADRFGGNARFSHTGFRFVHAGAAEIRELVPDLEDSVFRRLVIPPYTHDDFLGDLLQVTRGRIDRTLAETMVTQSNAAIHWMREIGIAWQLDDRVQVPRGDRIHFERGLALCARGGGLEQVTRWRAIAERWNVEVRYDSPVTAILGSQRRVDGLRVSGPEGDYEMAAGAVILCAGGFQANAEMRARYLGSHADAMKVRGSRYDTGEVLRMALDLGAQPAGQWTSAHCTPIDAAAPAFESGNGANRYGYPFGITVNALGSRFFDEGENQLGYTYAKTGWAIIGQPEGIAYQIFDAKVRPLLEPRWIGESHVEAESLAALAARIGVPAPALRETVEAFNRSVDAAVPFDPSRLDGRAARGLPLGKSNWALPLDTPPFVAVPVTAGITFSFGGLQVDPRARVLNTRGVAIDGLYASGDIMGLFAHNYPSMSGQTRNVVFSRIAAQHAVGHGG